MCPRNSVFHHLMIYPMKVPILSMHGHIFPLDLDIQIVKGDGKTRVRCFLKFIHLSSTRCQFFEIGGCAVPVGSMLRQEVIVYRLCLLQSIHLLTNLLFRLYQIKIMVLTKFVQSGQNMGVGVCQLQFVESVDGCLKDKNMSFYLSFYHEGNKYL